MAEKKKAKEKKAVDFIESLGNPSEELKIVTSKATAKSKGIELKNKEGAKWLVSRNIGKVGETRKVIYMGKMFGKIYDLENYLTYQVRRERYMSDFFFDTGLNKLKVEDGQYDEIDKFVLELNVKGYDTRVIDEHYRRKLRMENARKNKLLEEILKFKKFKIYFEYTPVDGS